MSKFVFVLKWSEHKDAAFFVETVDRLNSGMVESIMKHSRALGSSMSVRVRPFVEEHCIVMEWSVPGSFPQGRFKKFMEVGVKQLQSSLGCECSWTKV